MLDFKRHCNKSTMKLRSDSNALTTGYWFRTEPGAEVLEGESVFRSWFTWLRGEVNTGVGEQTDKPHPYYKGQNPAHYAGLHICGPEVAYREGATSATPALGPTLIHGQLPCCRCWPVESFSLSRPNQLPPRVVFPALFGLTVPGVAYLWVYRVTSVATPAPSIPGWTSKGQVSWSGPPSTLAVYQQFITETSYPAETISAVGTVTTLAWRGFFTPKWFQLDRVTNGTFIYPGSGFNTYFMPPIFPDCHPGIIMAVWLWQTPGSDGGGHHPGFQITDTLGGWFARIHYGLSTPGPLGGPYSDAISTVGPPVRYFSQTLIGKP